jgi:hypothetical protein
VVWRLKRKIKKCVNSIRKKVNGIQTIPNDGQMIL